MGIDLYCYKCQFFCSYSLWNDIRNDILKATYKHIKEILAKLLEKQNQINNQKNNKNDDANILNDKHSDKDDDKHSDNDDYKDSDMDSDDNCDDDCNDDLIEYKIIRLTNLSEFFQKIFTTKEKYYTQSFGLSIPSITTPVIVFNNLFKMNYLNDLILFNLGGIYPFIYKNDTEGYYTIGNSYDILQLLKIIKPYFIKNNQNNKNNEITTNYDDIELLEKLFQESIDLKKKIKIC